MVVYSGPRQPPFVVFDNSYYLAANWPFGLVTPYSLKQDHALCVSKHVYLLSIHIYMYVENQIHTWKSEDNLQGVGFLLLQCGSKRSNSGIKLNDKQLYWLSHLTSLIRVS